MGTWDPWRGKRLETVKGYVDHIIYRNSENGYTVFQMICKEEELTCVGTFPVISEGENMKAEVYAMKLLRVKAKHFKNCANDFIIDLAAKSRKTAEDKEYELQEIAPDLHNS